MKSRPALASRLLRQALPPIVVLVLFLAGWDLGVRLSGVPEFLIPSPAAVGRALVANREALLAASLSTGRAAIAGFLLSLVVGCLLAFVMAQARVLELSLYPYAIFLQTVPIIAIAPIIILWFGSGLRSIIVISFIISLFPIITNATHGLTALPPEWRELMAVYDASWWQRLTRLQLPAAVPSIVTGAKISAGLSVVGAIVGEYFTSMAGETYGIAYLVTYNADHAATAYLFATILTSAVLGLLIFGTVTAVGGLILNLGHFRESAS
jgi:NitT/TauT family transport system permease protein